MAGRGAACYGVRPRRPPAATMRELVRVALTDSQASLANAINNAAAVPGVAEMAATAARVAAPFGPDAS